MCVKHIFKGMAKCILSQKKKYRLTILDCLPYSHVNVSIFQDKEKKDEDTNEFVSAVCWRPVSYLLANFSSVILLLVYNRPK